MNAALQDNARHDGLGREGRAQEAAERDGLPNRPQIVKITLIYRESAEQRQARLAQATGRSRRMWK